MGGEEIFHCNMKMICYSLHNIINGNLPLHIRIDDVYQCFLADSKVISVLQKSEKDSTLLIAPCSSRILEIMLLAI